MYEYDAALKKILTRPGSRLLLALTGCESLRWMNVELHQSRSLRVDLLGEAENGELVQIELQSQNEVMWPRMGEYGFGAARTHGRFPRQIVLYVGEKRLRMKSAVAGPDYFFRFHLVDIRSLETAPLLESPDPGDNVIAMLTRLGRHKATLQQVLGKIARSSESGAWGSAGKTDDAGGIAQAGADGGTGGEEDANTERHYGSRGLRAETAQGAG